jgi:cell division protein FtsB
MVIRRRGLRSFFLSLGLYAVASAAVVYFVSHAHHGSRGLETKEAIMVATGAVQAELAELATERKNRDILDELARGVLGRVNKNDVVIMMR